MTHDTSTSNTSTKPTTDRPAIRQEIDEPTLQELAGRMVGDLGAAVTGALVVLGDRLGLYATLARVGPVTSQELAWASNLDERYVCEWIANQAASGYVNSTSC